MIMEKILKYGLITVLVALALYNAVNIKPLDEIHTEKNMLVFDAKAYAADFMANQVQGLPAIKAELFLDQIKDDLKDYAEKKGKKLGISDAYHFILEGEGEIYAIEEEFILVGLGDGRTVEIATDFIFGNAIRDGSGMANIDDYQNTMDFNSISVELNNHVRETIIPPLLKNAIMGKTLAFKGAVTIDISYPDLKDMKIIPLRIQFKD